MHAAQSPFGSIKRDAALYPAGLQAVRIELPLAVGPSEESSVVRVLFQINEKHSLQFCSCKDNCVRTPLRAASSDFQQNCNYVR